MEQLLDQLRVACIITFQIMIVGNRFHELSQLLYIVSV